jgi:HAE1 family hydrophobic/amphiphilic exporter-1
MFVKFFIHRPVFATVCSLLIILGGAVSIPTLPVAQFPTLSPPQVNINAGYTGANAQAVESAVTTLVEQAVNGAEGLNYISSSSTNDGFCSITATFDLGRDLDLSAVDVQNRASTVLGRLPVEVQTTGLNVSKATNNFVLGAGVYSDNNRYSSLFMSNYLDTYVKDAIKRVKGVGDVIIFSERKYSMRIWLDPTKLASRGLTAGDVVSALREQNVQVAAGQIGQSPSPKGQDYQISVRAVGRLSEASEFENIVIKATADGSLIKLRDIGRAELGAESYSNNLHFNGYDAIGVGVTQLSNANALEVDKAVKEKVIELAKYFPPGMHMQVAFDTTTVVNESIKDVIITLSQSINIVMLVIFLFLQSWRSTLITAVTIPVSLIGTFFFIKAFGFSINTLSLFGITLATGLVVDDAIVVIENVERHMSNGIHDAIKATEVAMKEVTGAVIATSLVLIAVFVPVAFFPGSTGRLYQQFALTIAFSIALSAFNALTLSPALAGLLLKHSTGEKNFVFRGVDYAISNTTSIYTNILRMLNKMKPVVIVLFLTGLGMTYFVFKSVPQSFVPQEDQGYFIVLVNAPEGASLEYTTRIADVASKLMLEDKDIIGSFAVPGFSFTGSAPNRAMVFGTLADIGERKSPERSAAMIVNRLRQKLFGVPGAMLFAFEPPPINGLGTFGGFQFQLQQTGGGSLEDFQKVIDNFLAKGRDPKEYPELAGLFTSYSARDPQYLVDIDRDKAKSLGVPFTQITSALQTYMGSVYVNDFDFNNRSYRVFVQADQQFRSSPRDLRQYSVRSDSGKMVPLDNLVKVHETTNASVVSHYNLFRSAEIDGAAAPGFSSGQSIAAMERLAAKELPVGYNHEWSGLSLEEIKSGSQSFIIFGLGLLVVYLTLSAQYESFVLPFIILLAVPMAVLGALGLQSLRGLQNDVYCQIGIVMLIGLSSKNAILIVEFAEQLRAKGLSLVDAAIEAAHLRMRPILMTSIAFILGVLPLVFAQGAGALGRHSVGTTVFGGMLVSTVLNLFIIPVLYIVVRSLLPAKARTEVEE